FRSAYHIVHNLPGWRPAAGTHPHLMIFQPFFRPATGCAGYLVGCAGKGVCAAVDPRAEDVQAYLEAVTSRGMKMKYVIDTHIQAAHRSGGRLLAVESGAAYALHRQAGVGFAFEPLEDGQILDLGNVTMRVLDRES